MRRINIIIATVILLVVLLIIEIIIVRSVSRYEPQQTVIFASERIPADTVIQENMLVTRKIGLSLVHRQSVRDIGEITGKRAKVDIEEGEMILSSRLGLADEIGVMKVLDSNNRLFSLELRAD